MARRNGDNPAVQDRDLRVSEWITPILPTRRGTIIKEELIAEAVKYAAANGLSDDPFFQGERERLGVYIEHNWTRIRKAAWRDGRCYGARFDKAGKMVGIGWLNDGDHLRLQEWACARIEAEAESQNDDAQLAPLRVAKVNVSLSLPRSRSA